MSSQLERPFVKHFPSYEGDGILLIPDIAFFLNKKQILFNIEKASYEAKNGIFWKKSGQGTWNQGIADFYV